MRGIYINLDRSSDRKDSLLSQLVSAGLPSNEYERFSAIEPVGDEPQLSRGLKSKGELGLFRSLSSVFAMIGDSGFDEVVHVVEDDAAFPVGGSVAIESVTRLMVSHPVLKTADIIFLDYFLNRNLFASVMSIRENLASGSFHFIPAKNAYLACTGSFLVKRSSASYISILLSRILDSSDTLVPVDLTLRALLRMGALRGFLAVPLLSAPGWEQDDDSTIQSHSDNALRFSQRSHILLRLLASGIKSPFWCAQRLEEMYGFASPLAPDSNAIDFLAYFDSLSGRMPRF